jgi:putative DNA primase/helicase
MSAPLRSLYEALGYASRGWPVFPCHPNSKHPLVKSEAKGEGGLKLATTDPDRIAAWWKKWPDAMIGVRMGTAGSGCFAVDLDPKGGETPEGLLKALCARLGALRAVPSTRPYVLPPAPMVRTPRGGLHVWFRMPVGTAIGNRAGVLPMIDVRGDDGYVILPPSTRKGPKARAEGCDGKAYAWESDASYDEAPPPTLNPFPQRGGEKHKDGERNGGKDEARDQAIRRFALAALDEETKRVEHAPRGARNDTLNKAAFALGQLVAAGVLARATVEMALESAADANGLVKEDGRPAARKTIQSGINDGLARPRDLSKVGARAGRQGARPPPDDPPAYHGDPGPQPHDHDGSLAMHRRGAGGASLAKGGGGGGKDDPPADGLDPEKLGQCAAEPQNDTGNARRLIAWFGEEFLNVNIGEGQHAALGLHAWTGTHWSMEGGTHAVQRFAQTVAERIVAEADVLAASEREIEVFKAAKAARKKAKDGELTPEELATVEEADKLRKVLGKRRADRRKFGLSCGNTARLNGMIAQALPHKTVQPDALDADPLAFNVLNGTLRAVPTHDPECPDDGCTGACGRKLWTMRLDPHNPADLIAKLAPVIHDPKAKAPKFIAFIERCQPKEAVRRFVRAFHGLAMTARTEQVFVLNYGTGANGKSTFMETIARLFGDYAETLPAEALTGQGQRRGDQATPELARLTGKRLVRCAELPRGESFRENTIKMVTGGDTMPVRHLHGRFFDLIPVFKAEGSCNEKPEIGGVDEGIWRRVKLVLWEVMIPLGERRPMAEVMAEFDAERSGILNWLIEGLLDYLHNGLIVPREIQEATESYRADMDPVGEFINACVHHGEDFKDKEVGARDMFVAYVAWCHANSVKPYKHKSFGLILPQKGIAKIKGRLVKYIDCELHDVPEDPEKQRNQREEPPLSAYAGYD